MKPVRIRTGIAKFDDGWNVIVNINGKIGVYDPTFATEAEAEASAAQLATRFRENLAALQGEPT